MKTSNPAKFKTRNWLVCDCDKCGEVWMAASGNAIAREFGKSSCPFRDRNAIKPKHKWHRRHHRSCCISIGKLDVTPDAWHVSNGALLQNSSWPDCPTRWLAGMADHPRASPSKAPQRIAARQAMMSQEHNQSPAQVIVGTRQPITQN